MQPGDWIALGGDALVAIGLSLTYVIYRRQLFDSEMQDLNSTVAALNAVRTGIASTWGETYFGGGGYDDAAAGERANFAHKAIMDGSYAQIFRVPIEPLVSLIRQPGEGRLVSGATIEAANVALWKIGVFNQLVQQQADFNALHLACVPTEGLKDEGRQQLAQAALKISFMIHASGIGDSRWYRQLIDALDGNVRELEERKKRKSHWWSRASLSSSNPVALSQAQPGVPSTR